MSIDIVRPKPVALMRAARRRFGRETSRSMEEVLRLSEERCALTAQASDVGFWDWIAATGEYSRFAADTHGRNA